MSKNETIIGNLDAFVFGGGEFMDDVKTFVRLCDENLLEEITTSGQPGTEIKVPLISSEDLLSVVLTHLPRVRSEGRMTVQSTIAKWLNEEIFADEHTHTCSDAIAAAATALLVEMLDTMERIGHDVDGPYIYDLIRKTYSGTLIISRFRTDC